MKETQFMSNNIKDVVLSESYKTNNFESLQNLWHSTDFFLTLTNSKQAIYEKTHKLSINILRQLTDFIGTTNHNPRQFSKHENIPDTF